MSDKYIKKGADIALAHDEGEQLVYDPVLLLNHYDAKIAALEDEVWTLNMERDTYRTDCRDYMNEVKHLQKKIEELEEAGNVAALEDFVKAFDAAINSTNIALQAECLSARAKLKEAEG